MNDWNEKQFYSLDEGGDQRSFFERYKKIIMAGGALLVLLIFFFVILFIVNVVQDRRAQENEFAQQVSQMISQESVDCEDGDGICEDAARVKVARFLGEISVCDGLGGEAYDNCVYLIALDQINPEICDAMNEEENVCKDTVTFKLANQNNDYTICGSIEENELRRECYANHVSIIQEDGKCSEFGIENLCESNRLLDEIAAQDSPAICDSLDNGYDHLCFEYFEARDMDSDGLNALEEYEYGASDNLSDTDGDGYSDKEEVENGFDPLS